MTTLLILLIVLDANGFTVPHACMIIAIVLFALSAGARIVEAIANYKL